MELPHLLVVQELPADLAVEFLYFGVEGLLLLVHAVELGLEFNDFSLYFWVLVASDPLDGVFLYLFDIADALEHVGDVVDASFLHLEEVYCDVEVDSHVFAVFDEIDELLGEDGKAVILSAPSALFVALAVGTQLLVFLFLVEVLLQLWGRLLADSLAHTSVNII